MRIVIIGNGVAGIEAAIAVRNREPSWDITIISEESDHFFSRTALMWVHCGQMSYRDIEPHERDLYARMRFERVRARATAIATQEHRVVLATGEHVEYDRLLIACGSRPRPGPWPGSKRRGVGNFVTMQDLFWFEDEVYVGRTHAERPPTPTLSTEVTTEDSPYLNRPVANRGRQPSAPAVIGGGLIGIEAVEVMVAAGLKPRFFIREEWFWPITLNEPESSWISKRMREHGVNVQLRENVETLDGDGDSDEESALRSITTDKGTYDCDLCVIAIGVVPATSWIGDAVERDRGGGIVVDRGLETSLEGVFACGDCASVPWHYDSTPGTYHDGPSMAAETGTATVRPEQLWYTARAQGRVAGRRLLGDTAEYERGLWYNSAKLMDIEYTTAGLVSMNVEGEENWFYEERGEVRSTSRIVVVNDRVIGFNFLGRRWDHAVFLRWIEQRRSLEYVLSNLTEASFDTELVPPLVIEKSEVDKPMLTGVAPSELKETRRPPRV